MNDVPVMALSGNDKLSLLTIRFYLRMAEQYKCSPDFIQDLRELVSWFEQHASENSDKLKLPD